MDDILQQLSLPWYVQALRLLAKILRKLHLGKIVVTVREMVILETLMRVHLDSIHRIRRFSVNDRFLGIMENIDDFKESLEDLAEGIRDTMAKNLAIGVDDLHCTLKYLQGVNEEIDKKDWKVYTLARSTPCNRPAEFLPAYHEVGKNSSFAALVGCDDQSNKWSLNTYICFASNDLLKHETYECDREKWRRYFKSTMVFPLQYRKINQSQHRIFGFLTFDSNSRNVFGNIPDIFDYKDRSDEYRRLMLKSSACHLGGMIADVLATTIYLQEKKGTLQ